ncbi:MAG TPA: ATP synthase F0 subunit A [Chloroflexi bacterium]|nr:ATP synthase F0 subunit A [Chloroflexota bacterium]
MEEFFPQDMFQIFGIGVRDTVVSTWVMMGLVVGIVIIVKHRFPAALEMLIISLSDMLSDLMKRPAEPYLPFLGSLALFIATANIIGAAPMLISPTRDINTPTALSIVVFFAVHYFGIRAMGALEYFKSLASPVFLAPLTLPLEIFGQLSRTLSLTLRLFGNIISTELVVAVIFLLVPLIAPLPLIGFSMFTGLLQAFIFTALAAVFIGEGIEATETDVEANQSTDTERS